MRLSQLYISQLCISLGHAEFSLLLLVFVCLSSLFAYSVFLVV